MATLEEFLAKNGFTQAGRVSKGWSSEVFLVQNQMGGNAILKVLRGKSTRKLMAERETKNLKLANSAGIGPGWIATDLEANAVLMEFVEGKPFSEWLNSNPPTRELEAFIEELYAQARALDRIGLDHGQLAGRGKNILVRNGLPVIIDFEKASAKRKCHNENVLDSFLFKSPGSGIAKKVKLILGQ